MLLTLILWLIHQSEQKTKQRNLTSKHISSAVHILMSPKESVWFRNRKKIQQLGWKKKKTKTIKIHLLVFYFIVLGWGDCPDSVCQAINCWSRTVFPDNSWQVTNPGNCTQLLLEWAGGDSGVTREGSCSLDSTLHSPQPKASVWDGIFLPFPSSQSLGN